jgi:N-sulfoglucosamine sulfohydrolase
VLNRKDRQYGSRTVEAYVHRPRHELYDLEADPQEVVNVADRPEHARLLAEFQKKLHEWQKRTNDPWLIKYEHE